MVGPGFTNTVIVETDGAQGGFEIVQAKTFVPKPIPVTDVVGDNEFVIVPLPETNDQLPVPIIGVFAFIVTFGVLKQIV